MIKPILKWPGSKTYLQEWIQEISLKAQPYKHRVHVFGGALNEFWNFPQNVSEVVNDIDNNLTNFFKVLQDNWCFEHFLRKVQAIPFSEPEFNYAKLELGNYNMSAPDIDVAAAFFVVCRQSLMGMQKQFAPLSKRRTRRGINEQASAWLSSIDGLRQVHERLKGVVIFNESFEKVIEKEDSESTLFICDPPYFFEDKPNDLYLHGMSRKNHVTLLEILSGIKGKFLLNGYHSNLYDGTGYRFNWNVYERTIDNKMSKIPKKDLETEVIWTNF